MKKLLVLVFLFLMGCDQTPTIPTRMSVAVVPDSLTSTPKPTPIPTITQRPRQPTATPQPAPRQDNTFKNLIDDAHAKTWEAINTSRSQGRKGYDLRDFRAVDNATNEALIALDAFLAYRNQPAIYGDNLIDWAKNMKRAVEYGQKCVYDYGSSFECSMRDSYVEDAKVNWANAIWLSENN